MYVLSLYVHVVCFYICMYLGLLDEELVHSKHRKWSTCEGLENKSAQAALGRKDSESGKCKIKTYLIFYWIYYLLCHVETEVNIYCVRHGWYCRMYWWWLEQSLVGI